MGRIDKAAHRSPAFVIAKAGGAAMCIPDAAQDARLRRRDQAAGVTE